MLQSHLMRLIVQAIGSVLGRCSLVAVLCCAMSGVAVAGSVDRSVVQIFNQGYAIDYRYPWRMAEIQSSTGSGVVIAGNRILTAAHVVDNSIELRVRRVGSDQRITARVEFISDARDMAILKVDDESFFDGTLPMKLGKLADLGDEVITYGFPIGGNQLAITKGIVSRIDYDRYSHSGLENLVCQIDAAINAGASGGPAIIDGKLAGLNFQGLRAADNVGYIIPAPVVQSFFDDIKDGVVHDMPEMAFVYQGMENPQLRKKYSMHEDQTGVLIIENSGLEDELGILKVGDVILSMDGLPVGNDGTVVSPSGDRINSAYLLISRQIGTAISLEILRDGKVQKIKYPLSYNQEDARILHQHHSGESVDFEVVGGLVVVELADDIVRKWERIPAHLEELTRHYKRTPKNKEDRALLIVNVLPAEINKSYENYAFGLLKKANGVEVKSLSDLRKALAENPQDFHTLLINPNESIIVFNKEDMAREDVKIRQQYRIGSALQQ